MTNKQNFKAVATSRLAGLSIIFYSVIIFVIMLFSSESLSATDTVLLFISFIAFAIGLGILKQNYYAWFAAMVIASINLLAQLFLIANTLSSGGTDGVASKTIWPLLIFAFVYSAKQICSKNRDNQKVSEIFSENLPCIIASLVCLVTLLALKVSENIGMLIIGFPLIIIEFAFVYIMGLKFQKMPNKPINRTENTSALN